jgi:hypothetical protein
MSWIDANWDEFSSALSASLPATRVQFGLGAVFQYSSTPLLRAAGFEDEDDDEDSLSDVAFCARWLEVLSASEVGRTKRLVRAAPFFYR